MIEVEDVAATRGGKGFILNQSTGYDETVSLVGNKHYITIATGNTEGGENWWNVCLNKEQAMAIARHLITLVRDMD